MPPFRWLKLRAAVWWCYSWSCILVVVFLPLLYSHAAMSTDGRSQIREINLSAMDVCWTNKLFLMRQFGLSQSNFAMWKRKKCPIVISAQFFFVESDWISHFLKCLLFTQNILKLTSFFTWTKSLHDMKSDLISVFADISYEIFVGEIKTSSLHQIDIHNVLKSKFSGSKWQWHCDCWMAVSDKTINRATNVFDFIDLFIILGKWNEDRWRSGSWAGGCMLALSTL